MAAARRAAALLAALCCLAPGVPRAEEEVRIALASARPAVALSGPDLAVFDADTGERLALSPGDGHLSVRAAGDGLEVRLPGVAGEAGPPLASARRVLVESEDQVRVDRAVYYGRLEVSPDREAGRGLLVVNRLPLETYLLGIVGSEMNPGWPLEALKAQAVAARTYAMQRRVMMRAAGKPYDLASTVLSQVYKGAERIRPSVIEAVKSTRGEVLGHRHALIEALFHSTCGGRTVSGADAFGREVAYLQSVPCEHCRDSDRYRWKVSYRLGEVAAKLRAARLAGDRLERFERREGAETVSLKDRRGRHAASPKKVRAAIGYLELFSDRFTARTTGKKVVIEGQGFGHGAGLCQWGARGMAEAGRTYREILGHYYREVRVHRLY
jgi:stage II sporulation protein D